MTDITIVETHGSASSPTDTDISSITSRFGTYDAVLNGSTAYPVPIPIDNTDGYYGDGKNYSYWKSQYLSITNWDSTEIKDIKWYPSGSNAWSGTGVTVYVAMSGNLANGGHPYSAYAQATGTPKSSGDPFWDSTHGHPYYKGVTSNKVDASTLSNTNPLWVMSGDSNTITSAGHSWGIVIQAEVDYTASHGIIGPQTYTWEYTII